MMIEFDDFDCCCDDEADYPYEESAEMKGHDQTGQWLAPVYDNGEYYYPPSFATADGTPVVEEVTQNQYQPLNTESDSSSSQNGKNIGRSVGASVGFAAGTYLGGPAVGAAAATVVGALGGLVGGLF